MTMLVPAMPLDCSNPAAHRGDLRQIDVDAYPGRQSLQLWRDLLYLVF
jgi:hypothetical protein